jgi:hypothetical protein
MGDEPDFPLLIGVLTHAPTYSQTTPREVKEYKLRQGSYEVILFNPGPGGVIGSADVKKDGHDTFRVRPHFRIAKTLENGKFWGAFTVDEGGIATLDAIYLVVPTH